MGAELRHRRRFDDTYWHSLRDGCHWQLAASVGTGGQAARGTQTLPVPTRWLDTLALLRDTLVGVVGLRAPGSRQ